MKIKQRTILCILILALAAFLRLWKLGEIPVSLYWDEAAIGYNAYSIATNGKDEYGTSWPFLFRSFDDYKLPGLIYVTAVFVKLLGLSELTIRLPSALAGISTCVVVYLLASELAKRKIGNQKSAYLAFLLIAISPWHLQFSRAAYEANIALLLVSSGLLCFLCGLRRPAFFFLAALFLGFGFYVYVSVFIFVPMMLGVSGLLFFQNLQRVKIWTLLAFLLLGIVSAPAFFSVLTPQGLTRFTQTNIAANSHDEVLVVAQKAQNLGNPWWARIIYNRRLVYVKVFISQYVAHFDPRQLFFGSKLNDRSRIAYQGLLNRWELPFVMIGFLYTLRQSRFSRWLIAWLLLAPIPAAASVPIVTLRSLAMLPIAVLLSSYGLELSIRFWANKKIMAVLGIVIAVGVGRYLVAYYEVWNKTSAATWADGHKQLVTYLNPIKANYDIVLISGHYWKPYIYFLLYERVDPSWYQKNGNPTGFGNYRFGGAAWGGEIQLGDTNLRQYTQFNRALVVLSPGEYTQQYQNLNYITTIFDHDNKEVFKIGKLRQTPKLPSKYN